MDVVTDERLIIVCLAMDIFVPVTLVSGSIYIVFVPVTLVPGSSY